GLHVETTYSSAAMGRALYVTAEILWDPTRSIHDVLDEWYARAFGPARAPMQRLLEEEWGPGFTLSAHALGAGYRALEEARAHTKDDADVRARVGDFELYLQYLRLSLEVE